jgi:diaminopropionate ammonia-lyase
MAHAAEEISSWPGYAATPLHCLPELAAWLGVREVLHKDEAMRFGLGPFKSLGGGLCGSEVGRGKMHDRFPRGGYHRHHCY